MKKLKMYSYSWILYFFVHFWWDRPIGVFHDRKGTKKKKKKKKKKKREREQQRLKREYGSITMENWDLLIRFN